MTQNERPDPYFSIPTPDNALVLIRRQPSGVEMITVQITNDLRGITVLNLRNRRATFTPDILFKPRTIFSGLADKITDRVVVVNRGGGCVVWIVDCFLFALPLGIVGVVRFEAVILVKLVEPSGIVVA